MTEDTRRKDQFDPASGTKRGSSETKFGDVRTETSGGEGRTNTEQPRQARRSAAERGDRPTTLAAVPAKGGDGSAPLLPGSEASNLRSRWESIQIGFVDEPRTSVQQADQLVGDAIKKLTDGFAEQRHKLEQQWDRGEMVSTEDLRLSLHRYRSFFERLVCI